MFRRPPGPIPRYSATATGIWNKVKKSIHYVAGGHLFNIGAAFEARADLSGSGNNAG